MSTGHVSTTSLVIAHAAEHLKYVLRNVLVKQAQIVSEQADAADKHDFATALRLSGTLDGLLMAETLLRDQIRGLETSGSISVHPIG